MKKKNRLVSENLCIIRGEVIEAGGEPADYKKDGCGFLVRTADEVSGRETYVPCYMTPEVLREMRGEPAKGRWIWLDGKLAGALMDDRYVQWIEVAHAEEICFPEDRKPTNLMMYCGRKIQDVGVITLSDIAHPEMLVLLEGPNGYGDEKLRLWCKVPKEVTPEYRQVREEKPFQLIGSICFMPDDDYRDAHGAELAVTRACTPEDLGLNSLMQTQEGGDA